MNGVTVRPLGEVAALQAGVGFPLDLQGRSNGKYPLAKVGDISRGGRSGEAVLSSADHFVDEIDLERLRAKPIPAGSVLFAKIGEAIRQNHRVIAGCPLLIDNNAMAAIPGPEIESRYLYYFLRTVDFYRIASATTVPALRKSELERIGVPLFALPEQRRIAEVLDRAEALRAKRRAALAQLDTLTQSIFLDLFGDPVVNPKHWPLKKFSEIGTLDRGVSKHRPRNSPELLGGKHPLVQTGEVANCDGYIRSYNSTYSDLGLRQSKMWPAGTLCITIAANIAKTGILTFDACFPDSVVGFRAEDAATVEFARTWLSFLQKTLEDNAPESAQKNINLAILRDLDVPLPPIELQLEFAHRIAAVDKLKSAHRASLAKLDALFASLQHRAFRGEL